MFSLQSCYKRLFTEATLRGERCTTEDLVQQAVDILIAAFPGQVGVYLMRQRESIVRGFIDNLERPSGSHD